MFLTRLFYCAQDLFGPKTFVHPKKILTQIFIDVQFFLTKLCPNISFWSNNFFGPNMFFLDQTVFWTLHFLDTQFLKIKSFLNLKFGFGPNNFLDPTFLWTQTFFLTQKFCLTQNFIWTKNFLWTQKLFRTPNFFGPKSFSGPKIFLDPIFLQLKFVIA